MSKFRAGVDRFMAWVVIILMGAAVINVLWQVFTRWVLQEPSSYTEELARFLLIWVGLLGAGYAAGKKLHLAIDLLPTKLTGRPRMVLEIVIEASMFLFALFVMVIGGMRLVTLVLSLGQTSAALGVPLGYVYLAIPISGVLIMYYSALYLLEGVAGLRGGRDLTEPDHSTPHMID